MNNQNDPLENIAMNVLRDARQDSDNYETNRAEHAPNAEYNQPPTRALTQTQTAVGGAFSGSSLTTNQPKTSLEGQFTKNPKAVLESHKESLSGWQGFLFRREVGVLRREEALKIARAIYEREFEAVMQKLTLSLDIEKKRTFADYVRSTNSLQRELQQLDAQACLSLTQSLMDINVQIYTAQNRNEQLINNLLRKGVINNQQAAQEHAKNQDLSERNLSGALVTLEQMWDNHKKLLEQTLRVSLDELIVKGRLK